MTLRDWPDAMGKALADLLTEAEAAERKRAAQRVTLAAQFRAQSNRATAAGGGREGRRG